jgi:hypothetical protein
MQAVQHGTDWCAAVEKTRCSKALLRLRHIRTTVLNHDAFFSMAAEALTDLVHAEVGLIHILHTDRRHPTFQTYSSCPPVKTVRHSLYVSRLRYCTVTTRHSAAGAAMADLALEALH